MSANKNRQEWKLLGGHVNFWDILAIFVLLPLNNPDVTKVVV